MKVLIVDFDHYEMLYALMRCLQHQSVNLAICSNETVIEMLQRIDWNDRLTIDWIICNTPNDLLGNTYFDNKKFDISILNTVYSHFHETTEWLKSFKTGKVILTIHNVNFWFKMGSRFKLLKKPRSHEHTQMLKLTKIVDAFLMLSDNVKQYAIKNYSINKPIIVFPYSINEIISEDCDNDKITIVVPGIIEEGRKDYIKTLDAFSNVSKTRYRLVLLGKPKADYGKSVIVACENLIQQGFDIKFYESYVEQAEFEKWMHESDILLAPIIINTRFAGIEESYGLSKETGAIFDMIRYARPGIIPKALTTADAIQLACLKYDDFNHIVSLLNNLDNKDILMKLKENAKTAAKQYHYTSISEKFLASLQSDRLI